MFMSQKWYKLQDYLTTLQPNHQSWKLVLICLVFFFLFPGIAGGLVKSKNSDSEQSSFIASPILPSYDTPLTSYQSSQSSYQSPQSSYQSPQSSYQSPQISYQSPQSSYESPQVSYVLPSGDFLESYTTSTSAPFSTGLSDVGHYLRTSFDNKILVTLFECSKLRRLKYTEINK